LGGKDDNGNVIIAANRYGPWNGQDYEAGLMNDGVSAEDMTRIWKIERTAVKALRRDFNDNGNIDHPIPTDILEYPAIGNPNAKGANNVSINMTKDYLPFEDKNQDGIYNANDGDLPIIKGDMQLVWLMNDDRLHTQTGGVQDLRLKVDIVCLAYANTCGDDLIDNTLFLNFDIYNNNTIDIDSFYVGIWTDSDLGCPHDDYTGSIPTHNSFFFYNENQIDGAGGCSGTPSYGNQTPIQSVTTLNNSMDYFTYYFGGSICPNPGMGSPQIADEYYKYMTGRWRDGSSYTFGSSGYGGTIPANHVYSGNPGTLGSWAMGNLGVNGSDIRPISTTSFGKFKQGQKITYELAYITHENNSPMSGSSDITPVVQNITNLESFSSNNELDWDIYLNENPTLTIGQPLILTVNIDSGNPTGNYSYLWSTGETTQNITATAPIPYEVTVTNNVTGCWKTERVHVSFPTSTESINTEIDKINIFPNPAKDMVTIDLTTLKNQKIDISIIDITGKVILNQHFENIEMIQLDVTEILSGVYFLKFQNEAAQNIGFKKIVITE
jgi:hypothetical protein